MVKNLLEVLLGQIMVQLSSPEIKKAARQPGTLVYRKTKDNWRYYVQKKNRDSSGFDLHFLGFTEDAAVGDWAMARIRYEQKKRLAKNKALLEELLEKFQDWGVEAVLRDLPVAYSTLPAEYLYADQLKWANEEYAKNGFPVEVGHVASDGQVLRSKSEVLIYELLRAYRVPFRYEPRIELIDENGFKQIRYPDFVVRLGDGSYLYWEHLGFMADAKYRDDLADKLGLYQRNGIYLGKNLILTSESHKGEVDLLEIGRIIVNSILPRM